MIHFLLNNKVVDTDEPAGMPLLDLIRYRQSLTGTKIGCREGDCGACTVLIGKLEGDRMVYRSATSCLTALGTVHHRHVVTIEGLGLEGGRLNFLQQAIVEEGGTQCGFCTPGFIVSMAGLCLGSGELTAERALASIDGNICRCTGYKSIERALGRVLSLMLQRDSSSTDDTISFAVEREIVPDWFRDVPRRMAAMALQPNGIFANRDRGQFLGGGTDLYVQQQEGMADRDLCFLAGREELRGIYEEEGCCYIGGAVTVSELIGSELIRRLFPHFDRYARLISSTPIRNIATVAGNFVNASPIGDLSIFFLALDAQLVLCNGHVRKRLPLRDFFIGYKRLDKAGDEYIERVYFKIPSGRMLFNFEKVSKRTHLDIASVNTAMRVVLASDGTIAEGDLSAGGVGPIPVYLAEASALMKGKIPGPDLLEQLLDAVQRAISPIGDARGSIVYKRLLLGQLIKAHFITLFPQLPVDRLLSV